MLANETVMDRKSILKNVFSVFLIIANLCFVITVKYLNLTLSDLIQMCSSYAACDMGLLVEMFCFNGSKAKEIGNHCSKVPNIL